MTTNGAVLLDPNPKPQLIVLWALRDEEEPVRRSRVPGRAQRRSGASQAKREA